MNEPTSKHRNVLWAVFALIFVISLSWPTLVTGHYFTFADTPSYLRGGAKIWDILLQFISSTPSLDASVTTNDAAPTALTVNEEGRNVTGRSFPYSAFASLAFHLGGPLGLAFAQAAVSTLLISFLINRDARQSSLVLGLGAVVVVSLTALPWYSTLLMPDLFGAFVVLFGIVLVRDIDDLGFWQIALLVVLAGFAATALYGNMPLMAGIVISALGIRLLRWRLTWTSVIAGIVAAGISPAINIGASSVVLNEPSVAPRRLPIILARSLADGPSLWHLQETCPEAGYALCDTYVDSMSQDTVWFLWSDEGVLSLPKETLDQIREEELKVVWGAFKSYPIEQTKSLLGNAARQLFRVGVSEFGMSTEFTEDYEVNLDTSEFTENLHFRFDQLIPYVVLASAIAIVGLGLSVGLTARWVDILAVMALGYIGNALLFGGLSAPIDRYQGRTAWLIPVLLVILLAEMATQRRRLRANTKEVPA